MNPTGFYFQKLIQTVRVDTDFRKLPGEEIPRHHCSGDLRSEPSGPFSQELWFPAAKGGCEAAVVRLLGHHKVTLVLTVPTGRGS